MFSEVGVLQARPSTQEQDTHKLTRKSLITILNFIYIWEGIWKREIERKIIILNFFLNAIIDTYLTRFPVYTPFSSVCR